MPLLPPPLPPPVSIWTYLTQTVFHPAQGTFLFRTSHVSTLSLCVCTENVSPVRAWVAETRGIVCECAPALPFCAFSCPSLSPIDDHPGAPGRPDRRPRPPELAKGRKQLGRSPRSQPLLQICLRPPGKLTV